MSAAEDNAVKVSSIHTLQSQLEKREQLTLSRNHKIACNDADLFWFDS